MWHLRGTAFEKRSDGEDLVCMEHGLLRAIVVVPAYRSRVVGIAML